VSSPASTVAVRRLDEAADLAAGVRSLSAALAALPVAPGRLRRLEVPLAAPVAALDLPAGFARGSLDPLALLGPRWSGAGASLERELGSLDRLADPDRWLAALGWPADGPELRFALSARFDPGRPPAPEWEAFGSCRVWLPAIECDGDAACLALNWIDHAGKPGERERLRAALDGWRPHVATGAREPLAIAWNVDAGARRRWLDLVAAALARIGDQAAAPPLVKIVLARRLDGALASAVHPADLLGGTALGTVGWPWWIARSGRSWLGESPEVLGVRADGRLRTVALAGTRGRAADPARDAALGRELLACDKDGREQAAVADWLRRQLARLSGREPVVGALELVRLPSLQHLGRSLETAVDPALPDRCWLDALHPTPALCGAPRAELRRWLRNVESFDRGLYGGVVGRIQRSRAEAHVAIRGVLVSGTDVAAYAGAGLVRGSDPVQEWAETGTKLAAICRRLGLATPGGEGES